MDVRTALAYSCNCYVAHFAERFRKGQLAVELAPYGFHGAPRPEDVRLQALGVDGVLVSAEVLAHGYRRLALGALAPVVEGVEGAVEYGTAQRARVAQWKVAGKTGSAVRSDGAHVAWFAGFAPSRAPLVAVAVMLQGRSGGADAAPIAGRILDACRKGTL
jgi:cell division protein FtsI/penicillin-binding protein 2